MKQQYSISSENLDKVERTIKNEYIMKNRSPISLTVADIAEKSGVALATAHKALKELERKNIIITVKSNSRREATQYIYNGSFKIEKSKEELELLVQQYEEEIKLLKQKLSFYENDSDKLKVISLDNDLEIIVKRKK